MTEQKDDFMPLGNDDADGPDTSLGLEDGTDGFKIETLDPASQKKHRQNTECMNQLRFAWKNITKVVNPKAPKTLLDELSGHVSATQVLAIMGPSGSGKTTLLDVLSGRASLQSGEILVNGRDRELCPFQALSGYVPQDDFMEGSLTVRETLLYTSYFSMAGEKWTPERRIEKVDSILRQLDLTECADVHIGTVFLKGISGGQKRRVSIGMELVVEPSIIFLDEPTSGLDSASAVIVTDVLFGLAMLNYTVLCTIHQPSAKIFTKFHLLCLLSAGKLAYFGPTSQAESYFEKLGAPTPPLTNPANHYLDIINPSFNAKRCERILSEFPTLLKPNIDKIAGIGASGEESAPFSVHEHPSQCQNIMTLLHRNFLVQYRNPSIYGIRIAMYLILGLFLATLYLDLERDEDHISDRVSVLFFTAGFLTFMSVAALPVFIEQRAIYNRESFSGCYKPFAYAFANAITPLPSLFVISFSTCAVKYFAINLNQSDDTKFIYYALALYIALYGSESLVVMVSIIAPVFVIALVMSAMMMGASMLFCGFFILRDNIPDYYIWIHYGLSMHNYYFTGLMVNEFTDISFKLNECYIDSRGQVECEYHGYEELERYGLQDEDRWEAMAVLASMAIALRIVGFLILMKKKGEQR